MLETNICVFIMREQSEAVIKQPEQAVLRNHRVVVTCAGMRFNATGRSECLLCANSGRLG